MRRTKIPAGLALSGFEQAQKKGPLRALVDPTTQTYLGLRSYLSLT